MILGLTFIAIFNAVVMGYWCSLIAKDEGRSPSWAWLWGILFGIFAVLVYYIIGNSQEKKALIQKLLEENRRENQEKDLRK